MEGNLLCACRIVDIEQIVWRVRALYCVALHSALSFRYINRERREPLASHRIVSHRIA